MLCITVKVAPKLPGGFGYSLAPQQLPQRPAHHICVETFVYA